MSVFKDFPGIENLEKNSKTFKDFQGPARALIIRKPCHIVFNGYDIKLTLEDFQDHQTSHSKSAETQFGFQKLPREKGKIFSKDF